MERDLIEEINARTKFPITKQDSYGHAIYHGAKKIKNVKKQGKKKLIKLIAYLGKIVSNFHKLPQ